MVDKIHFHINKYKNIIEIDIINNLTDKVIKEYYPKVKKELSNKYKIDVNYYEYKLNFYIHRMIPNKDNLKQLVKLIKSVSLKGFKQIDIILDKPMKIQKEILLKELKEIKGIKIFSTNKMYKYKYWEGENC